MHPDSRLDLFATEAAQLEEIDEALLSSELLKQKAIAGAGGADKDEITDAKIKVEVYEALSECLKK